MISVHFLNQVTSMNPARPGSGIELNVLNPSENPNHNIQLDCKPGQAFFTLTIFWSLRATIVTKCLLVNLNWFIGQWIDFVE